MKNNAKTQIKLTTILVIVALAIGGWYFYTSSDCSSNTDCNGGQVCSNGICRDMGGFINDLSLSCLNSGGVVYTYDSLNVCGQTQDWQAESDPAVILPPGCATPIPGKIIHVCQCGVGRYWDGQVCRNRGA